MPTPRQDTDAILSYYQSVDADQVDGGRSRQVPLGPSSPTSSSSPPSIDHPDSNNATRTTSRLQLVPLQQPCPASPPADSSTTGALRRTSLFSQGCTDERRLAIVETDAHKRSVQDQTEKGTERGIRLSDSGRSPRNNSRSHLEAHLEGLAFAAPPDASPHSYSASVSSAAPVSKSQPSIAINHSLPSNHVRSSLDTFGATPKGARHVPRTSSREVAIVGTTNFPSSAPVRQQSPNCLPAAEFLRPPLFQIPQSRSPSPGVSDISDSGCSAGRGRQRKDALAPGVSPVQEVEGFVIPVRTPNIGESKHLSDRVAGPIIINLFSQPPLSSPASSSPHSSSQDLMSPITNLPSPLTPSTASTSPATSPSPYLHYQPGLHAIAGPLPPPPQAVFNIDSKAPPPPRPPRHSPIRMKDDLEVMKQALQLPPHVTAALKAKFSPPLTENKLKYTSPQKVTATVSPMDSPSSSYESFGSDHKPRHVREGAFPPSRLCTFDHEPSVSPHEEIISSLPRLGSMDDLVVSIGLAIDDMGIISSCDVPPPTVVEPPRGHEGRNGRKGLEIRRADNFKISLSRSLSPEPLHVNPLSSSPRSDESTTRGLLDPDKTIALFEETVPPVPAKKDPPYLDPKSLKNALNTKRFSSLPRTPSLISLNQSFVGKKCSSGAPASSATHSVLPPKPPVQRNKSTNPPAMYFADVTVKRTVLERSIGYAYKINELYNCDCGLGDWIAETRYKALHPHSSTRRSTVNSSGGPRAPSTTSPSIAPRHISQSSTDSGVTFPRRADAYSATDLAPRAAGDASPPNAPPPLPYPALAATPRGGPSRASTMIATSSSSSSRSAVSPSVAKSPGSFFASLGRKTSIKKEKPLTPPSPARVPSKSPPRNGTEQPTPRVANLPPIAQSVPGGPRAPPNRMQRSRTIVVASQNSVNGASPQRCSTMTRRPSLFGSRGSAQQENGPVSSEAEFNKQVDKLAALLPKADRNVLATYLRRAGQDILAIGQYLEDEKNGTLRYE